MTVLHGADELTAALRSLDSAMLAGARAGVTAAGRELVRTTRAQMGGDPRWSRRGPGRTGPAVDTGRRPIHIPQSGGPGVLTGNLRKRMHQVKPKQDPIGWSGKVSAMGGEQNLYAARIEQKFPFLAPALKKAEPAMAAAMESAWAKRIARI